MEPCVPCIYLTYSMEYVWKSSLWIGYFKELHHEQEYYWPTIYITGAAVVSTITSLLYITYIRSILENSSPVFHRTLRNCVNYNLAKWRPRKTAKARYKDNLPQLSYAKALELSGLQTLCDRREAIAAELFDEICANQSHSLHNLLPS